MQIEQLNLKANCNQNKTEKVFFRSIFTQLLYIKGKEEVDLLNLLFYPIIS